MEPKITAVSEHNSIYKFTLYDIDTSIANAIRRTIIMDIPMVVFKEDACTITKNTGRLHNEILKQRLSCIPVHINMDELEKLPGKYILVVNKKNEGDSMIYVTTEDFQIRNKNDEEDYLPREEVKKIFPPFLEEYYIEFSRLRPKISNSVPGEELSFVADFTVSNAHDSSTFNSVSKCSYSFTPDLDEINKQWTVLENKLKSENLSKDEIEFKKKNYYLLDAERIYKRNSFDFVVKSVGVYKNSDIVKKAVEILIVKIRLLIESVNDKMIQINTSETTMDYSYDIILEYEDYTIGKVLEYVLYTEYYDKKKMLSFCGFRKVHPHDSHSIVRLAFNEIADKDMVNTVLKSCFEISKNIFEKIYNIV